VKEQLTRKQAALILALLNNPSVDEACKSCGVGRSSFYRWQQDHPVFRRAYADAKQAAFSDAITILSKASSNFATVLEQIALDKDAPMTARVSACRAGLEWSTRGIETEAIAADAKELADELRARRGKKS